MSDRRVSEGEICDARAEMQDVAASGRIDPAVLDLDVPEAEGAARAGSRTR
ncbi:MAG: hypothetical protein AAF845_08385 [Bacteroidota bacterium]